MLVPGWAGDDRSMRHVRSYLDAVGFDVHGWGSGRNTGDIRRLLERTTTRVDALVAETDTPLALVGHSLGGWIAREVARDRPDLVTHVVTLGTPVIGGPNHTLLGRLVHRSVDPDLLEAEIAGRFERPLVVTVTEIRSPRDGIVPARVGVDEWSPAVDHIEVAATHIGMVANPEVLLHIATALDPTGTLGDPAPAATCEESR